MPTNMYAQRDFVKGDIDSAIMLLCEENGSCTISEVMNLARLNSDDRTKEMIIIRAEFYEFRVEKAGRGYRIYDW